MAISASSKILALDVTTALGTKIDTAGTGLTKDGTTLALASVVTAGTVGGTGDANLSFGSTFTTPYITYDAYGRITGSGTRSLALPSAPSGGSATATPNIMLHNINSGYNGSWTTSTKKYTIPSGGTWAYMLFNADYSGGKRVFTVSGGSAVNGTIDGDSFDIIAFRVS